MQADKRAFGLADVARGIPPREEVLRYQRTRSAYFPFVVIAIFFAMSECAWSTTTTYPCQSFDVSFPHRGHLSSSLMKEQWRHARGTF